MTQVRHNFLNDTRATRVKNFDFDKGTSENMFLYPYTQGEEQFHSKNYFFILTNTMRKNLQILATEMCKILNGSSPILCKTFLKLGVTIIILIMRQHFPQEILKQLDMDYRPSLT